MAQYHQVSSSRCCSTSQPKPPPPPPVAVTPDPTPPTTSKASPRSSSRLPQLQQQSKKRMGKTPSPSSRKNLLKTIRLKGEHNVPLTKNEKQQLYKMIAKERFNGTKHHKKLVHALLKSNKSKTDDKSPQLIVVGLTTQHILDTILPDFSQMLDRVCMDFYKLPHGLVYPVNVLKELRYVQLQQTHGRPPRLVYCPTAGLPTSQPAAASGDTGTPPKAGSDPTKDHGLGNSKNAPANQTASTNSRKKPKITKSTAPPVNAATTVAADDRPLYKNAKKWARSHCGTAVLYFLQLLQRDFVDGQPWPATRAALREYVLRHMIEEECVKLPLPLLQWMETFFHGPKGTQQTDRLANAMVGMLISHLRQTHCLVVGEEWNMDVVNSYLKYFESPKEDVTVLAPKEEEETEESSLPVRPDDHVSKLAADIMQVDPVGNEPVEKDGGAVMKVAVDDLKTNDHEIWQQPRDLLCWDNQACQKEITSRNLDVDLASAEREMSNTVDNAEKNAGRHLQCQEKSSQPAVQTEPIKMECVEGDAVCFPENDGEKATGDSNNDTEKETTVQQEEKSIESHLLEQDAPDASLAALDVLGMLYGEFKFKQLPKDAKKLKRFLWFVSTAPMHEMTDHVRGWLEERMCRDEDYPDNFMKNRKLECALLEDQFAALNYLQVTCSRSTKGSKLKWDRDRMKQLFETNQQRLADSLISLQRRKQNIKELLDKKRRHKKQRQDENEALLVGAWSPNSTDTQSAAEQTRDEGSVDSSNNCPNPEYLHPDIGFASMSESSVESQQGDVEKAERNPKRKAEEIEEIDDGGTPFSTDMGDEHSLADQYQHAEATSMVDEKLEPGAEMSPVTNTETGGTIQSVSSKVKVQDRDSFVSSSTPPKDIQVLLDLLPRDIAERLRGGDVQLRKLSLIVLDKGRQPTAWVDGTRIVLDGGDNKRLVTTEDIHDMADSIGFANGGSNRAGIQGYLHRISAVRNHNQDIIGLTIRVVRHVSGSASLISDLLLTATTKSILFLGKPSSGKTTMLRDSVGRLVYESDEERNSCNRTRKADVVIVDTINEIAGDSDIPHPSVGLARRVMVPSLEEQGNVMIACVQNQHPDVLVIDEICHPADAQAAWICKHQRNVRLLAATAEAKGTLRDLVKIPYLNRLIGGVRKKEENPSTKTILKAEDGAAPFHCYEQRIGTPVFDIIVEICTHDECRIVLDAGEAGKCHYLGIWREFLLRAQQLFVWFLLF